MPKIIYKERDIRTSQLYFRKTKLKNVKMPAEQPPAPEKGERQTSANWIELSQHSISYYEEQR